MEQTYQGSCHCGKIQFEAKLDLSKGSGKCNCSICSKTRAWWIMLQPTAFRLLAGQENLSDYQFAGRSMHHVFCTCCGARPFAYGHLEVAGGDFYTVNLACLDNVAPEVLAQIPVHFSDGKHDNWQHAPEITTYL